MTSLTKSDQRQLWLTREFVETILKTSENQVNLKVIDFVLHDALAKGLNYCSYLIRLTVNYIDDVSLDAKQKSFVIKTTVDSDEINGMLKKLRFFDKEIVYYRDIQPKHKSNSDVIDNGFKCSPRCYAVNENPTYIVLEDLKAQNYRNADRFVGLDFNATALLLQKLAKLHALNAKVYDESPELFTTHKIRLLDSDLPELLSFFRSGIANCQQMCLKWPNYKHFYDKLQYWSDNVIQIAEQTYNEDESTFNTLTHGDLWLNNMMYQFDDKNIPTDVLMIDYQIGFYGPPALDISYLFYSSTSNDIKEPEWNQLLQIYHFELVKSLDYVKYPNRIPSLAELQMQMLKNSLCSAMITFTLLITRHIDTTEEADLDTLMSDSDAAFKSRCAVYNKPLVYERLHYLLDHYDRNGFFTVQ